MQSPVKQVPGQASKEQQLSEDTPSLDHLIFKQQYRQNVSQLLEYYQETALHLHDNTISIRDRMFINKGFPHVFGLLQEINTVKKLFLNNNLHCRILIQIKHVSFPNLLHLNLRFNNILTVECLQTVSIPNLKILDISNNAITTLKGVRKLQSSSLTTLSFNNNFIQEYECLTELHARALVNITVEENHNFDTIKKSYMINVTWYFKLESTGPRILISSKSLKNKKILCRLKEKVLL